MPAGHSRHVAFPETPATRTAARIANGRYALTGDLIRTAIRVLRSRAEEVAARTVGPVRPSRGAGPA